MRVFSLILLICIACIAPSVKALNCTTDLQCWAVSDGINYVDCVNKTCKCVVERGFVGDATPSSKCRCVAPNEIVRSAKNFLIPYCQDPAVATALQVETARTQIRLNQVRRVYDGLVGNTDPFCWLNASLKIPNSCGYDFDTLFDPSAMGRFDPIGAFGTQRKVGEYFYPFANSGGGAPHIVRANYVYLYGVGDNVFVRVDLWYGVDLPDGSFYPITNLTQSGNYRFNDKNLIVSVDAIIHNAAQGTFPTIYDQEAFIVKLCQDLTINPGANYNASLPQPHGWCPPQYDTSGGGYTDYDDCYGFMKAKQAAGRFGDYNIAPGADTVVCRRPHADISKFDPINHCLHAGKTGGGFCVDKGPYPFQLWPGDYYVHRY